MLEVEVEVIRRRLRGSLEEVQSYSTAHPEFLGGTAATAEAPLEAPTDQAARADADAGTPADRAFERGVAVAKAFFTRRPACPPQFKRVGRAALQVGAAGLAHGRMAEILEVDPHKISTRMGPLGRRIVGTPGAKEWLAATATMTPTEMFFRGARRGDGYYYVPTPLFLAAVQDLADSGYFDT